MPKPKDDATLAKEVREALKGMPELLRDLGLQNSQGAKRQIKKIRQLCETNPPAGQCTLQQAAGVPG